jgi:hypothetical protein
VEVTREVLSDRRLKTVRALSRQLSGSESIKTLWRRTILGIEGTDKDIPLALLYSVAVQKLASKRSKFPNLNETNGPASTVCILESLIGIPVGHELAAESLDLGSDETCLASPLKKAIEEMTPVVVQVDGKLKDMFERIEWRGHGVPATQVIVCPITPGDSNNVLAFLIIALNPRRPYDDDYRGFVHLLTQQLCITVTDTGCGLDESEIKNLFHLFAQASPKTYQTYGGSGLGLFISRQLVEMQGREIGVASQAGKGSIFQFYVRHDGLPRPRKFKRKQIYNC